ncbi:MAG TPA: glutamate 5-kinase [Dehalococcoidia bacterium]|nr:glutamate 5-kinase [Dehalococcoidia bacterium]
MALGYYAIMNQVSQMPSSYKRIVAKFGTSLLTAGTGRLDLEVMASLVEQVVRLHRQGLEVILVSSGAVAAGRQRLGDLPERRDVPFKQVLAAVGQSRLMNTYERLLSSHDIPVAQALLTRADISQRAGYLNARNALLALLELRVLTIVNENDVVAVEELEGATFGDNDNLSAMVANLVDADLLVILTDQDGLFTADPRQDPSARLIPRVERIDNGIERLARETAGPQGTGGMATKIEAARLATSSGIAVAIAKGRERDILPRLVSGEALGTFFPPVQTKLESRCRWLLAGPFHGRLVVDGGAARALREQNRSLLPVGVLELEGDFSRGELVQVFDREGNRLACGLSNYGSGDLKRIKGVRSERIPAILGYEYGEEVIHRNNLVVL